jgi:SAM-dependent methyltransferase
MELIELARRANSMLPASLVVPTRRMVFRLRGSLYRGDQVECACCGRAHSRFLPTGNPKRPASCPSCDSRERQRLLTLYLRDRTNLYRDQLKILHVAPEDCIAPELSRLRNLDYVSADLASSAAMVRMDVTNIQFPDHAFDVILCSHVLEHVPDDSRAMREFYRVLRPGGWALLQVPIDYSQAVTREDPSVTDPRERERLFGQWDHVRAYGSDYPQRLREAGFAVEVVPYSTILGADAIRRFGLDPLECIHLCRRSR